MEDKIFYMIGTIAALFYIYTQINPPRAQTPKIVHVAVPQYIHRYPYRRFIGHRGHRGPHRTH